MPPQVSILLYTTVAGRATLSNLGYKLSEFTSECTTAVAEAYVQLAKQDFDAEDIEVDGVFERNNMSVSLLLIVVVAKSSGLRHHRHGLGHQAVVILRSRFIREGIEPNAIPRIQAETVLAEP
jgi:hypothetical protein